MLSSYYKGKDTFAKYKPLYLSKLSVVWAWHICFSETRVGVMGLITYVTLACGSLMFNLQLFFVRAFTSRKQKYQSQADNLATDTSRQPWNLNQLLFHFADRGYYISSLGTSILSACLFQGWRKGMLWSLLSFFLPDMSSPELTIFRHTS